MYIDSHLLYLKWTYMEYEIHTSVSIVIFFSKTDLALRTYIDLFCNHVLKHYDTTIIKIYQIRLEKSFFDLNSERIYI